MNVHTISVGNLGFIKKRLQLAWLDFRERERGSAQNVGEKFCFFFFGGKNFCWMNNCGVWVWTHCANGLNYGWLAAPVGTGPWFEVILLFWPSDLTPVNEHAQSKQIFNVLRNGSGSSCIDLGVARVLVEQINPNLICKLKCSIQTLNFRMVWVNGHFVISHLTNPNLGSFCWGWECQPKSEKCEPEALTRQIGLRWQVRPKLAIPRVKISAVRVPRSHVTSDGHQFLSPPNPESLP